MACVWGLGIFIKHSHGNSKTVSKELSVSLCFHCLQHLPPPSGGGGHQRFPSTGKVLLAVRRTLLLSVAPWKQHLTKGHTGQNHMPNSSCYLLHLPGFQSTVSKLWWSNILSCPSCPATECTGSGNWSGLKILIFCWFPMRLQKQLYQQNQSGSTEFAQVRTASKKPWYSQRHEASCTLQGDLTSWLRTLQRWKAVKDTQS